MDPENGLTPILTPTPKGAENTEKDEAFQGAPGFWVSSQKLAWDVKLGSKLGSRKTIKPIEK
jgi:hypothetical protein